MHHYQMDLRKTMGSKQIKMIFTDKAEAGKSVMNVDVPEKDRNRFYHYR